MLNYTGVCSNELIFHMDVVIKRLQKEKGDNVLFNNAVNTSGGPINWNNGILDGKIQIPTIQLQSLITGYK